MNTLKTQDEAKPSVQATLRAFHNDPKIKAKYLKRVRAHRKADEIVHGTYWENGKGCAIGCTVHSGNHALYETELGMPAALARIEDGIFEGMPNGNSMTWPERFLQAIPVGAELRPVVDKFLFWLLVDETDGVIRFAKTERSRKAIQRVGDLYARKIKGEIIKAKDWRAAAAAYDDAAAAYAAAAYAAAAAADYAAYAAAAAAYAAYAAAAADYAAYAAADYAAYAAADAYARLKTRICQSEKLIELLKAA